MVKIDVHNAGRWRVARDTLVWIDVWAANAKLAGVPCQHHGCQPLRKIVRYDLKPGAHWVVVEGRKQGDTGLLLSPVRNRHPIWRSDLKAVWAPRAWHVASA
jgi:hypothetical protein